MDPTVNFLGEPSFTSMLHITNITSSLLLAESRKMIQSGLRLLCILTIVSLNFMAMTQFRLTYSLSSI